jgi:hypothetical protein
VLGHSEAERLEMPRALSGLRGSATVGFAALISLCPVTGQSLHASDEFASRQVRTAALTDGQARPAQHQVRDDLGDQLEWLLAQGSPVTAGEGNSEAILAGFPLSTLESVEEEVSRDHRLELVRRFASESLGKRIVVFRVRDGRTISDVLAALKSDPRVGSAQLNVRYEPPKPELPAPQIGELKQAPIPQDGKGHASQPDRKVNLSSRGEAREKRSEPAQAARPGRTISTSGQQAALTTRSHGALRFPTADEPFVNVGTTNK